MKIVNNSDFKGPHISFYSPILGVEDSAKCWPKWDDLSKLFEQAEYQKAILILLNYLYPEFDASEDQKTITIPHGSLSIQITFQDGHYEITAPFIKLPQQKSVPLLRQITELNFNKLILSQINLNESVLSFNYQAPLELSHPSKVHNVLREICLNGDFFDDVYIDKFGATHVQAPLIAHFTPNQKQLSWQIFQNYIDETSEILRYLEKKNTPLTACRALMTNMMAMNYTLSPQGLLRSQLAESIEILFSLKQLNDVISKGKELLAQYKNYDRDKFNSSLYRPKLLFSGKAYADLTDIQRELEPNFAEAKKLNNKGGHLDTTIILQFGLTKLLYYFDMPLALTKFINDSLLASNKQPWNEASDILWKAVQRIMDMRN